MPTSVTFENAINIYADGSCFQRPRRGGMGIRFVTINAAGNEVWEDHVLPGYLDATNNQMELLACIKALEMVCEHEKFDSVDRIYIFTDSMYVTSNILRAYTWSKQRWLNSSGRPIENAELWKDLLRQKGKIQRRIEFRWIKGHSKNVHNKAVDKLAKQSANGVLGKALRPSTVRKKITSRSVIRGSVKMESQILDVGIITDTYSKLHKLFRYKFEVLSEDSKYKGNVDWIYYSEVLRAGHHYRIRVNSEPGNPRIVEVVEELPKKKSGGSI